jgi:hypothetical protein
MVADPKLLALRKTHEVQEKEALEHQNKVDQVVTERRIAVAEVVEAISRIETRVAQLRGGQRGAAIAAGSGSQLSAISEFEKRLAKEKAALGAKLLECQNDLDRALQRLEFAQADLITVRVELKKIDRILDNRAERTRRADIAREEVQIEEMNYGRRRK